MKIKLIFSVGLLAAIGLGCETRKLPYLGEPDVVKKVVDGKESEETV